MQQTLWDEYVDSISQIIRLTLLVMVFSEGISCNELSFIVGTCAPFSALLDLPQSCEKPNGDKMANHTIYILR